MRACHHRRTLRFAPQPCGARECAKLRESCVTARRPRSHGRTVGRALCHARRAVSRAPLPYRPYRFGASPVPLVGPDGERRSVHCGSLLIAEPRCCRRRYSRRRYCTELYCKARLGTPTSSPRRNFAALAAPGEGGSGGRGKWRAPLPP